MQTIGERLEEARKRKGISIREAAEQTKIRGDYLQKFEANSFDIDLPPLYIRGFVRTYARFLELDSERLVGDVDALLHRDQKAPRRESREALGRVDFGAAESRTEETAASAPDARSAREKAMLVKFGLIAGGAVVAIVLLLLVVNALFSRGTTKSPAGATPVPAKSDMVNAPSASSQTVTFTATAPTRLKIVAKADNSRVIADNITLAAGQSFTVSKTEPLVITVEDRTKLRMEINGRLYGIPRLEHDPYGKFALD